MREPRSYIVRIYRQGYRTLSGIVEDTHTGGSRPFRSSEELAVLLRAPIAHAPTAARQGKFHSIKR